jgi:probable HAF family extracellular repeat protein
MARTFLALASVWLMLSGGWAQRLVWLGQLPGGLESEALGVSADGTVVVGTAINSDGFRRAFRWTESDGMQDLGTLGGVLSIGNAVSADGQTIVGYSSNDRNQLLAFRWRNGQMTALGTLSSVVWGEAYGVSADGSVIAGHSWWGSNFRAARWQGNTVTNLGTLPGAIASRAWGVSGDGQVIVGASFFSGSGLPEARAVRWQGTTIQQLGELAGYRRSWAFAASHDGLVIVGFAYADNESAPSTSIRWVNGQPQNLGWLPLNGADGSIAYGVSGDGSVVVGNSDGRAYRWTETRGMENLNTVYASLLADGSQLYSAQAISADGRFIVGRGLQRRDQPHRKPSCWTRRPARRTTAMSTATAASMTLTCWRCCSPSGRRARNLGSVDVNCDGRVDDADLLIVLFAFGSGC